MTDWLSETEEELDEYRKYDHESAAWFIEDIALMARVLRELSNAIYFYIQLYGIEGEKYLSDDSKELIGNAPFAGKEGRISIAEEELLDGLAK